MQLNEKRKTSKVTQRTPELSWPPSVTDLERQEKDMPCSVEEFLETLQCSPDHPNQERARLLVQSYSNDLIFGATRGKLITLKHFLLGLGLHNLTGQKVLVQFLSNLGHSMDCNVVCTIQTAEAIAAHEEYKDGGNLKIKPTNDETILTIFGQTISICNEILLQVKLFSISRIS